MVGEAALEKTRSPVSALLLIVLGVVIVVAVGAAVINKTRPTDPTLTAAPPIVAAPGRPLAIHTKSPRVLALEMQQDGVSVVAGKPAQPPQPQPNR